MFSIVPKYLCTKILKHDCITVYCLYLFPLVCAQAVLLCQTISVDRQSPGCVFKHA